jgi:hypothetical protein
VADERGRQQVVELVVAELELAALLGWQADLDGAAVLELDAPAAVLLVEADPFVVADFDSDDPRSYQPGGARALERRVRARSAAGRWCPVSSDRAHDVGA